MADTEELLRILIQLSGRREFPPETLREIVGDGRNVNAYNLCDGTRTQAEVVKGAAVDQGQFSRTSARWVQEGVLFRLGSGRDVKLLHLHPLQDERPRRGKAGSEK
ncbi:MAG: hypothetical protein ACRDT7_14245 [Microbacterium sp.]